jgi:hypothetical protein
MPLSPIGDFCIKVRTTTRSQNGDVMQVLVSDLIVQRRFRRARLAPRLLQQRSLVMGIVRFALRWP